MIKQVLLVVAVLILAAGAVNAQSFTENFENGLGGWTQFYSGYQVATSSEQNATPGGSLSVKLPGTTSNGQYALDKAITNGYAKWTADIMFYDSQGKGGGLRNYVQFQSYAGTTLQQLISLGAYNSSTNVYNVRIAVGGLNWFDLTTERSVGWHHFQVNAQNGTYTFFCDNAAPVVKSGAVFAVTNVRIGSGLSNGSIVSYVDDINYGALVPEPGSLLALGTGLLGVLGMLRRRSA